MNKPSNYDEVQAKEFASFSRPNAGPAVLRIIRATEQESRNGNMMLVLGLDIAEGEHKNYYVELSKKLNKDCLLKYRQLTDGKNIPYFKGVVKAIEESNNGYRFNFDEKTLLNKLVGTVLQEEEYESGGKIKLSLKPAFLCSAQKVRDGKVKAIAPKTLEGSPTSAMADSESKDDVDWLS